MSLSSKLKSVFTSGDQYTVLTLLQKMIETIDKYENAPLYEHRLNVNFGDTNKDIRALSYLPSLTVSDLSTKSAVLPDTFIDGTFVVVLGGSPALRSGSSTIPITSIVSQVAYKLGGE